MSAPSEEAKKLAKAHADKVARLNKKIESLEEEVEAGEEAEATWQVEWNWPKRMQDAGMGGAMKTILAEAMESAKRFGQQESDAIKELHDMFYP